MQTTLLLPAIGTALWVSVCLVAAFAIWRERRRGQFHAEHVLLMAGVLLLAFAPCIALIVFALSEKTSIWGGGLQLVFALILFASSYRARRYRLDPVGHESVVSFREKSAILILAAVLTVYLSYFVRTWDASLEQAIPEFVGSIILLILVMVIGHIAIALGHMPIDEVDDIPDERDSAIEAKSARNSHYVLACGFWAAPVIVMLSPPTLILAHVWLAVLVFSEVVKYGSSIAYYRYGEL